MTVLAIETATTICAAAVVSSGKILAELTLDEKYIHAEKLMTLIDAALVQSGRTLSEIDGVAISIGPGSFTGLRIGLSVAKGLAFATGRPLISVPTLGALAQRVVDEGVVSEGETILAALDARRDEVYCQRFLVRDGMAVALTEERDVPASTALSEAVPGAGFIAGDASEKLRGAMNGRTQWTIVPEPFGRCSAGSVGRIGEIQLERGEVGDLSGLEPRYIKEFFFRQQS